jgi:SAM-dependent methyltransferase
MEFPAGFFERAETERRGAERLDDAAVAALRDLYSDLEIDGRVLDLCLASGEHFDLPPDELVSFDGDPDVELPFADAAFDDALCSGGVGGMTRPLETFAEVARVLKPGGRFVGSVFLVDGSIRYRPMVVLGRVAGVMGPSGGIRDLRRWFDDAGLVDARIERSGAIAYFDARTDSDAPSAK